MNIVRIRQLLSSSCPDVIKKRIREKYNIKSLPIVEVGDYVRLIGDKSCSGGTINTFTSNIGKTFKVINVEHRNWDTRVGEDITVEVEGFGIFLSYNLGQFEKV